MDEGGSREVRRQRGGGWRGRSFDGDLLGEGLDAVMMEGRKWREEHEDGGWREERSFLSCDALLPTAFQNTN